MVARKFYERGVVTDTPGFFEDTSFVAGESPFTLDIQGNLGRNAIEGYIINDGPGEFNIAFSKDGLIFGDEITMKKNEIINFDNISVDSLRITHTGTDSAYRASVI